MSVKESGEYGTVSLWDAGVLDGIGHKVLLNGTIIR